MAARYSPVELSNSTRLAKIKPDEIDYPHSESSRRGSSMRKRSSIIVLCLILAVALAFRLWGIGNGLPYAQVTDETEDMSASLRIASGGTPSYYYIRVAWN